MIPRLARHATILAGAALAATALGACAPTTREEPGTTAAPDRAAGTAVAARDTTIAAVIEAAGVAEPYAQATLGTKLMGSVTAVLVQEGDVVRAGAPLVRIDARDLAAKRAQVSASIAEAEAVHRDAETQAGRIRALHADSAATRAQLDAAETGLARAAAGVHAARAASAEVGAVEEYATIRAPFAGVVTRRFVDPGAFAAPGAPLVTVQDGARLRVRATAAPDAVRGVRPGSALAATIEGRAASAVVEGIVPAPGGNLYVVNALVDNRGRDFLPGSAATLALPQGPRQAIVVPSAAVRREGELTGVLLRAPGGDELRWVRLGREANGVVEVLGGLSSGELVVVPAAPAATGARAGGE